MAWSAVGPGTFGQPNATYGSAGDSLRQGMLEPAPCAAAEVMPAPAHGFSGGIATVVAIVMPL